MSLSIDEGRSGFGGRLGAPSGFELPAGVDLNDDPGRCAIQLRLFWRSRCPSRRRGADQPHCTPQSPTPSDDRAGPAGDQSGAVWTWAMTVHGEPVSADGTESDANVATPTVSVIIPTVDRPDLLLRAVRSAFKQTHCPAEVIVVSDGGSDAGLAPLAALDDDRLRIIRLPVSSNDAAATPRNIGIAASSAEYIALLDDDDEWLPDKLSSQLDRALAKQDKPTVVSSRVERRTPTETMHWPRREIAPTETVADYLFVRNQPGEGWLPTPTLLLPRALAVKVPFGTGMKQHEDIDWLLRLEAHGASFEVVMDTLAIVHVGESPTSLSSSAIWRDSLAWAAQRKDRLGNRAYSAFCLTEVSRVARAQPSVEAFAAIFLAAVRGAPRARDLVQFLLSWVMPRGWWTYVHRLRSALVR